MNILKFRFTAYSLFILLTAISLVSCNEESEKKELVQLHVGVTGNFIGDAPVFVALEKEMFRKNGLDLTVVYNDAGAQSLQQLKNGEVDLAHVADTPFVLDLIHSSYSNESAAKPLILTNMLFGEETQKILWRNDENRDQPVYTDSRFATYEGTQLEYLLDAFLIEKGLSADSIDVINLSVSEQLTALQNNRIDISMVWEPFAHYILSNVPQVERIDLELTYPAQWLLLVQQGTLSEADSEIKIYMQTLSEAMEYIDKNPGESQQITALQTGVPVDVIRDLWDDFSFIFSFTERDISLLEEQRSWALKKTNTPESGRFLFENFIYPDYLLEIAPENYTVIQ